MAVSRNAPCPCGSGKKYKRCCQPRDEAAAVAARRRRAWPWVVGIVLVAVAMGVGVGTWRTPPDGVAATLAVLLAVGGWWSVMHAPRSGARANDPGGATIDFGRGPRGDRQASRDARRGR